ncbi:unnamed protein product [Vitrella brassicaformis CCMP3155]|uniref:Nickel/cobalt efflux system n=2 Tax=Vitrella brassicaformis TaxID=1169539 RepID=A0A0G4H874_VITBC|nr:unnamed protein product [Vitrella brassicaformis CCMP3155]|eukprot:CEM39945.1 unnamed protein product [Vitrella brassicaformis CCMP3155]
MEARRRFAMLLPGWMVLLYASVANADSLALQVQMAGQAGLWIAMAAGGLAGGLHAVTGADHLGALLPLCVNKRWFSSFWVGFNWGCGHGIGAALLGALAYLLKDQLAVQVFSDYMDFAVGTILIIIGLIGIMTARQWEYEMQQRKRDPESALTGVASTSTPLTDSDGKDKGRQDHTEAAKTNGAYGAADGSGLQDTSAAVAEDTAMLSKEGQESSSSHDPNAAVRIGSTLSVATIGTGIVHGISGSGHFLGVLPALTLPSWATSAAYLVAFCLGCCVSMSAFTSIIGETSVRLRRNFNRPDLPAKLSYITSGIAITIGCIWLLKAIIVGTHMLLL